MLPKPLRRWYGDNRNPMEVTVEGVLNVGDALRRLVANPAASIADHEQELGVLAVLAAQINQDAALRPPAAALTAQLASALAAMPPHAEGLHPDCDVSQWMNISALCELHHAADLARLILNALEARLTEAVAEQSGATSVTEVRGLFWARRGRVSRTEGQLDDAWEWYESARRLVRSLPWRDAAPHAALGLSVLAMHRGNLPGGARRASAVLAHRPLALPMYRVQAHQIRAHTLRRKGQLLDALLHSWQAYDLLPEADVRQFELLIMMAEIAVDYGDWVAAQAGFLAAATAKVPSRVRVPALVGLVDGFRRLGDRSDVGGEVRRQEWIQALENAAVGTLFPAERVLAAMCLAETCIDMHQRDEATRWIDLLEEVSVRHGFNEKALRAETLRGLLAGLAPDNAGTAKPSRRTAQAAAHAETLAKVTAPRAKVHDTALRRLAGIGSAVDTTLP